MMTFNALFQRGSQRIRREWVHRRDNARIRAIARRVASRASQAAGQSPVIFFNASTRLGGISLNAAFSQLASWSLRLAGVPVLHFVCQSGLSRCVLGTDLNNPAALPPCADCIAQSRALFSGADVRWLVPSVDPALQSALQNLSLEQLPAFEWQSVPLGRLVLSSLRWALRRHHLEDNAGTRFLFVQYILSAWNVYCQFSALLDETQPRCLVVFNGQVYPEATARFAALRRGVRVITHEVGLLPYTGFFTPGEATAYPIDIPAHFQLSAEQDARLDAYLEKRFQGNFSMAGIRFWPEMRSGSPAFWQRAAAYQQVVPVFTNVIFDTSQGHANTLFPHMFAWLDQVLEIARAHPETFFVLRAHPDETRPGKESRESVADWVRANRAEELPNLLFVDAGEYFSSYELIQKSKFVMVYNSTIGLEATLMGVPVLCGGRARYTQLPTVFFPDSAGEYRLQAEQFLSVTDIDIPPAFRQNARRFLYYQLFRTSLPFADFIEDDGIWRGYVRFKAFRWQALLPENAAALRAVADGILYGKDFLLEE